MAYVPCFLCGIRLRRKTDKNKKAYLVCNPCGMQIFVRRQQGIENLDDLIKALRRRDIPFREHAESLHKIQAILIEIKGVKEELKKLDSLLNVFRKDEDKPMTRKLLRARIDTLLSQLEEIASPRHRRR